MENCKRCPFCGKAPVFFPDLKAQWRGGCASSETEMCATLVDVVYQPSQDFAMRQWNHIVTPLEFIVKQTSFRAA